jgi:hypothetical protein
MGIFDFLKPKQSAQVNSVLEKTRTMIFPDGKTQEEKEMKAIREILGKDNLEKDCYKLLYAAKFLLFSTEDKSFERMKNFILTRMKNNTDGVAAKKIYDYLYSSLFGASPPQLGGGTGATIEDAVIINADNHFTGVDSEYSFITGECKKTGNSWKLVQQALLEVNGKHYDKMDVELDDGNTRTYYFDISSFVHSK